MTSISADTSELDAFARDLAAMEHHIKKKLKPAVKKAGVQMKDAWRADAASSTHFHQIAPTINFDVTETSNSVEVEVGPDVRRRAARLENIWLFGGVNGGGGTGKEPMRYLDDEVPRFENAMGGVIDEVWGR